MTVDLSSGQVLAPFGGDIFWDLQMPFGDPKRYRHQREMRGQKMASVDHSCPLRYRRLPLDRDYFENGKLERYVN